MPEAHISTTAGRRELARQVIYEHGQMAPELDDFEENVAQTYQGMLDGGAFAEAVELDDEDYEAVRDLITNATILFPSEIIPDQSEVLAEYDRWRNDQENPHA